MLSSSDNLQRNRAAGTPSLTLMSTERIMALVALSLGSSPAPAMLDDVCACHGQRLPSALRNE